MTTLEQVFDSLRSYHVKMDLHEPKVLEENISWYRDLFDLIPEKGQQPFIDLIKEEPSHIDMYFLTIDVILNVQKEPDATIPAHLFKTYRISIMNFVWYVQTTPEELRCQVKEMNLNLELGTVVNVQEVHMADFEEINVHLGLE